MNANKEIKEKDKKYFGRGSAAMNLEVIKTKGSLIFDANGKEYIDFLGGSGVDDLGWDNEELEKAIRDLDRPAYVYPNFYYKAWTELAELLAKISPGRLTKSFRATGGSEAVEAAMQIAMMYTGRKKFLSVEGSYHGNTIGTLSIGASANEEKFPNLLWGCEKIDTPLNEKALQQAEEKLQNNEIAALIMEPIICNLGIIIPKNNFLEKLAELCKRHGTLLVMDEAITGFGRTGKLFASEYFNIKPDLMVMAKALSGGHAGIGAVITTPEIADAVEGKIGLYSSYGWHPVSTDVAIANIKYILEKKNAIFDHISKISELFEKRLSDIKFKEEPELRIKGLAIGVDVKDEDYATEIKEKCFKNGLLMNTEASTIMFLPALNISAETVNRGLAILEECT